VRLFRAKGFEATTTRELAAAVGIESASLYNHFGSKQDLLADLLISVMEELVASLRSALDAAADGDPADQLRAIVRVWVVFHDDHLDAASISDTERRALRPADRRQVLELREEVAEIVRDVIRRGSEYGQFEVDDTSIAALAVMSICARVATWYRPNGRLQLAKIADLLADAAVRLVAAAVPSRGSPRMVTTTVRGRMQ
jgi:AcrR family transcriptional regulator